ncbi:unnamed protein product [Acanthoscelides obtectus]|uniref:Cilia- and flagella-associated protein 206 n=1 Tax=Acanthoscelides obtectus TaxID=200917 RepID=A0A9P0K256_ACAOB|nr:unnamed protein product [Acanthoscelides obtectus]CAK1654020.1 Cilia- and flagella-associated protein 206 [Acanthoscelides obtectus]
MPGDTTADNIVRNIQRETLKQCMDRQKLRVLPGEKFVSYIVRLHLLNPSWGITENFMECRTNVVVLVKHLYTLLESHGLPSLVGLKMQYFYQCSQKYFDSAVLAEKKQLRFLLAPLKAEILKTDIRSTVFHPELLQKRIISYAILLVGLGNPQKVHVYNEAYYAFKSVMDQKDMFDFVQEEDLDAKEKQLKDIVYIIGGVRLFNKYSGKTVGWDIKNIIELLNSLVASLKGSLQDFVEHTTMKIQTMQMILDKIYVMEGNNKNDIKLKLTVPSEFLAKDLEKFKDTLGILCLYRRHLNELMDKVDTIFETAEKIYADLLTQVEEMFELISKKVMTAAEVIFPEFISLCSKWVDLQDALLPLTKISAISSKLNSINREVQYNKKLLDFIDGAGISDTPTDVKDVIDYDPEKLNPHVKILSLDECEHFNVNGLECQGYCPFKFVETCGGLFKGKAYLHLATFEGKTYSFSSLKAKIVFSDKPKKYVNGIILLCRDRPHFTEVLQMRSRMEKMKHVKINHEDKVTGPKFQLSEGVQCEKNYSEIVPPSTKKTCEYDVKDLQRFKIDRFGIFEKTKQKLLDMLKIDADYHWNIWEMRKEALNMATITNCQTVSQTTAQTHTKISERVQTDFPVTRVTQTTKHNYSNTPNTSSFIFGLRNPKPNNQFVVDLTLPVDKF